MVLTTKASAGHIDIDQLSKEFKKSVVNIPLATLYRIFRRAFLSWYIAYSDNFRRKN